MQDPNPPNESDFLAYNFKTKNILHIYRLSLLSNRSKGSKKSDLASVIRKCAYGDFFLLMQLSKHFDPAVYHEFIIDLRDRLKDKRDEMEMNE